MWNDRCGLRILNLLFICKFNTYYCVRWVTLGVYRAPLCVSRETTQCLPRTGTRDWSSGSLRFLGIGTPVHSFLLGRSYSERKPHQELVSYLCLCLSFSFSFCLRPFQSLVIFSLFSLFVSLSFSLSVFLCLSVSLSLSREDGPSSIRTSKTWSATTDTHRSRGN